MPRIPGFVTYALAAQAALALAVIAGCGESGARVKPTVVAKPATKAAGGDAAPGTASPGAKADGNGAKAAGGYGTFAGRVVLKGEAPKLDPLVRKGSPDAKDAAVCAAMDVPDDSLVVGEGGGIANVFIYLAKPPAGGKNVAVEEEPAVFDQKFCRFKPHALALRVGRTMNVLNDDAVAHNTHNYPVDGDNPSINPLLPPMDRKGVPLTYVVQEKVPVAVKCDIHTFMRAFHMPVNHPYFAVTDETGKFEIKDLPAGNHEFVVWQERKGYLDRGYKVSITGGETTEKTLSYEPSVFTAWDGPEPKVLVLKTAH